MRLGAAQDMAAAGVDLGAIMHAGGWKTPDMVMRYITLSAMLIRASRNAAPLRWIPLGLPVSGLRRRPWPWWPVQP